jgi:hypothetical protein
MPKARLIAETFDLQRRNKLCNIRGCGRLPTKKLTLFEENRITWKRKSLATLYLCAGHNETRVPGFLTEMNKHRRTGEMIGRSTQEMGFLTY